MDCFYSWEHWHMDNFLFYVIRITPTGQNSKGWAKGVQDNIKGEVSFCRPFLIPLFKPFGVRSN